MIERFWHGRANMKDQNTIQTTKPSPRSISLQNPPFFFRVTILQSFLNLKITSLLSWIPATNCNNVQGSVIFVIEIWGLTPCLFWFFLGGKFTFISRFYRFKSSLWFGVDFLTPIITINTRDTDFSTQIICIHLYLPFRVFQMLSNTNMPYTKNKIINLLMVQKSIKPL